MRRHSKKKSKANGNSQQFFADVERIHDVFPSGCALKAGPDLHDRASEAESGVAFGGQACGSAQQVAHASNIVTFVTRAGLHEQGDASNWPISLKSSQRQSRRQSLELNVRRWLALGRCSSGIGSHLKGKKERKLQKKEYGTFLQNMEKFFFYN